MLLKRYFFLSSFFLLMLNSLNAQVQSGKFVSSVNDTLKINTSQSNHIPLTDSIINYGKLFLNTRYRHGSSSASGFDCSGFTSFVYRNFGYNLSHSSSGQAEQVGWIDRLKLKIGDLVFFSGRHKSKKVGHVGIVVSAEKDGRFNFIHSSSQNGVIISSSEEPYYMARFIKAGRVIADNHSFSLIPQTPIAENYISSRINEVSLLPVVNPVKETTKIIPAKYYHVKKGETLSSIALKCGISLAELKRKNNIKGNRINPKQHLKIKDAETILIVENTIPAENKPVETVSEQKKPEPDMAANKPKTEHIVQKGETLFSISNLYNITVDELKKLNNILTGKIRTGQKLKLNPQAQQDILPVVAQNIAPVQTPDIRTKTEHLKPPTHKVIAGETLFEIAKLYNISVPELKKMNNLTDSKIKNGQILKLSIDVCESVSPENPKPISVSKEQNTPKLIHHKVCEGETLYSIANKYGCTVPQLKKWNAKTANKIKAGQKLAVYTKVD